MQENNFIENCFAFPFTDYGVSAEFFEGLQQENADFKLSFGTAGLKIDSISQNLQRIPMENNTSAKSEINFETNYFFLKKFFNKNILFCEINMCFKVKWWKLLNKWCFYLVNDVKSVKSVNI